MLLEKIGYSVDEAGHVSSVGRTLIYQEIAAGNLRSIKVGRRTVIRAEDLKAWLDAKVKAQHGEAA